MTKQHTTGAADEMSEPKAAEVLCVWDTEGRCYVPVSSHRGVALRAAESHPDAVANDFEKALSAKDALVLSVPAAGFGNVRAGATIENLAKVGWKLVPYHHYPSPGPGGYSPDEFPEPDAVAKAVEAEREACARVADDFESQHASSIASATWHAQASVLSAEIAVAIRARATSPSPPLDAVKDDAWIIVYEDAEMPDEKFSGHGATEAAIKRFDAMRVSWNCHLFKRVIDASGWKGPEPFLHTSGIMRVYRTQLIAALQCWFVAEGKSDDDALRDAREKCARMEVAPSPGQASDAPLDEAAERKAFDEYYNLEERSGTYTPWPLCKNRARSAWLARARLGSSAKKEGEGE